MTSKERAFLRGLAMKVQPTIQIGKLGLSETLFEQINDQLEARELIKISVLDNSDMSAKDIIAEIAKRTQAEPVQAIGSKITLFRFSKKEGVKHILDM